MGSNSVPNAYMHVYVACQSAYFDMALLRSIDCWNSKLHKGGNIFKLLGTVCQFVCKSANLYEL